MSELSRFEKHLLETLEKRSVEALLDFIKEEVKHGTYLPNWYDIFKQQSEEVKIGALCKMIIHYQLTSEETKEWAKQKLEELNMSPNLYEKFNGDK